MKTKHLLLAAVLIIVTAIQSVAQNAINGKLSQKTAIPFGKKLPPPNLTILPGNSLPGEVRFDVHNLNMQRIKDFNANDIKKNPAQFKQQILQMRNNNMLQKN